ncbi:M16 family metallopeptidase [Gracilinema caldarium]|uniref:Processing peptidase n=1 Tax=Gracilinema caldarium (strain ATCC 51460 / DSM 7334 / H1) TaxID=744872 RepID=F8F3C9_GRAC1|nr:pitrilysin family protein [Gracilinema caldarium]AEJ19505.1 processing peptidase [Gracilinema caldarium DSM 7334]
MIFDTTFNGGLRLLVESTAATDVAAVGVWYNRGSRDEPAHLAGATHIIEHMLFKGTERLSASQIARRFDAMGGLINAFTERETMGIHATIPMSGFIEAAHILTDMITAARFDPEEFKREILVIENEITASLDDVEEVAADAFAQRYWGSHPLGRSIGGTPEDVKNKDRDQVFSFYQNHFQGKPHLITIAGGLTPDLIMQAFEPLLNVTTEYPQNVKPNTPLLHGPSYHGLSSQYVQVYYALPGPDHINDNDYYALEVANAALGDAMGSRLFQKLREELGLCYTIYSSPNLFRDCSLFSVYGTCAVTHAEELIKRIHEEITTIKIKGLTEEEIQHAKSHVAGMITIAAQDVEYKMRRLARQALYKSTIMTTQESIQKIDAIELSDIQKSMDLFFQSSPVLFSAGPKSAEKRITRCIEQILHSNRENKRTAHYDK